MDPSYRCPDCGADRDHPSAYCDRCDYSPDPRTGLPEPTGASRPSLGASVGGALLCVALGAFLAFWLLTDVRDVDRAILHLHAQLVAAVLS